jgi:putative transposase
VTSAGGARSASDAGTNGEKPGPPAHDDRVQRDFHAEMANELWLTDISEHPTAEGKLYLCAVKDVFSNRIVGYSISDRMRARLAVDALTCAVARRAVEGADTTGCTVHSDRGSQGGFNWSSQHLDDGGARWDVAMDGHLGWVRGGSGLRIGRCGRRCVHRAGRSRLVECSGSSGG